jgi:hypothetical protein
LDCGVLTPLWFFVFSSAEQQLDVKPKAASKRRSPKVQSAVKTSLWFSVGAVTPGKTGRPAG